jgi:hypothetical protein
MALSEEELRLLDGDITGAVDPNARLAQDNLVNAADGNPDQFAADRRLGLDTDTDPDMVSRNRPQVEKLKYLDDLDLQALDETPKTKQWVENGDNARISFDDVQVLQNFERESSRNWFEAGKKSFENFGTTSALGFGKAWDGIALAFLNEAKTGEGLGSNASMDRMTEMLDLNPEQQAKMSERQDARNANLDTLIEERKVSMGKAEEEITRLTPTDMTVMEESIRGAFQMGVDVMPGMLVSALTRGRVNLTLGSIGGKVWGDSYATAILEGKEHKEAQQFATVDMVIEVATEKFPVDRLEAVVGDLGGQTVGSWMKRFMFEDLVGEQVAAIGQTINAYAHDLDDELKDANSWEEMLDIQSRRQAVALLSTVIGGGSMAGTVKGADWVAGRERRAMGKMFEKTTKINGSHSDQERLDNLISLAQASKTNERAADVFEDFVNNAAGDQTVYMAAEAVDLLDTPPGYLLEQMDGSGGDVAMPLSTFLKEFASDDALLDVVRPFIKTKETLSTQTELEQDTDGEYIKELLTRAAAASETKTEADAIYEKITGQIIQTGRQSTGTARQSAEIIVAQVTTQYEYLQSVGFKKEDGSEVTLEELFEDFNLEVVGPEADVAGEYLPEELEPVFNQTANDIGLKTAVRSVDGKVFQDEKGGAHILLLQQAQADGAQVDGFDGFGFIDEAGKWYSRAEALSYVQARYENIDNNSMSETDLTSEQSFSQSALAGHLQTMADESVTPRVLAQQNFSTIDLVVTVIDEAGNTVEITENAGMLWEEQQKRQRNVDKLRGCLRA